MSLGRVGLVIGIGLLSACTGSGMPAPVPSGTTHIRQVSASQEAHETASPWAWHSVEPEPSSSTLTITGGVRSVAPQMQPSEEAGETAKRRVAFSPGVAGQPMAGVGECVDLSRGEDGYTSLGVKPCAQPHTAQVAGFIDLNDGPQAPAPPLRVLQALAAQHCPILGSEFIGGPIGDRRDLTINWTGPSRREWAGGARTLVCMVSGPPNTDGSGTQLLNGDIRARAPQVDSPAMVQPAPPSVEPRSHRVETAT